MAKRKKPDLTKRPPNESELREVDRLAKRVGKKMFAAWNAKRVDVDLERKT